MGNLTTEIQVKKRDGRIVPFDFNKIVVAVEAAKNSITGESEACNIMAIANDVFAQINEKMSNTVTVEEIQDIVEETLMKSGNYKIAKNYILYRGQRSKARNINESLLDYKNVVDGYLKMGDWRVKENSTVSYSLGGLILSNSGAITANYWLSEIYPEEIANAHRNTDMHIHDLSMLAPYCFTGDTRVASLDGKHWSFKELVDNNIKSLWIYTYDHNTNQIIPSIAINPRITRCVDELAYVTLDNGKTIKCTTDHPFMTRDGNYVQASKLCAGQSLMPLYVSYDRYSSIGGTWTSSGKRELVHRWVMERISGRPVAPDEIVHHLDEDKNNNDPTNLGLMKDKEHRKLEIRKTMQTETWKNANNISLTERNKSDSMRTLASQHASSRKRDADGMFVQEKQRELVSFMYNPEMNVKEYFNHKVVNVQVVKLNELIDVYDMEVPYTHNFALDDGVFVHNCGGWSLKQLILEGLGGVTGKITSDPAKHLSTLCNQMVNFLGIMQNEWAGAQAFSSFDTYLAPFVKADNLTYKQVKQCIQSFAYGVNTPSRWGCVDTDTEVLSTNGWKKCNELQKGDFIYTWKDGLLNINPVNAVIIKDYKGKMHSYKNKRAGFGYEQTVTSDHRVLYKNETGDWNISHSDEIFEKDYTLPVAFSGSLIGSSKCNQDDCYKIIDNISNGDYDIEKYQLTQNDARTIFIGLTDSSSGYIRIKDNKELIDCIQHLAILAGYATNTMYDDWEGYDCIMYYITKYHTNEILPTEKESYDYDGIVWCPSVDDGTAVFRRNGSVFISGQCQAPFTNITLDVNCPPDMIDMPALVGGEPQDFTYGDCKEEMEMVNKAFIEVMIEGDADGRGLQYPIPTYSITKDYDWSEDNEFNRMLFEMAAKYGIPYFSNYVNSDMEPSDVRSMCPLTGDTLISVYITHGEDQVTKENISIKDIYDKNAHVLVLTRLGTSLAKPVRMPMTKVYRVTFDIGNNETVYVDMGENHLHPVYGYDEPVQAKDLKVGMICETGTIETEGDTASMIFKVCSISAIEEVECNDEYLYCLEVLNAPDDKYRVFALANGIMTHNCRLRLDLRELRKKSGGFFGSGESTGSVGVVTINMPKIAYLSESEEEFYEKLDHMMDLAAESIKIKRKTITKLMDAGLYPYTKKYLGTFNNHFSTIGLVGMNEACLNAKWIQKDLTQPEAQSFTENVLNHMRNKLVEYQEKYGDLYNLEATPAESTTYRFAKHDKEMYPDIITANENGEPYYTNSSHLPVGYTEDVFTALDIQDKFQTLYTSGTVFHTFLGERLPDWKVAMTLVRAISQNYKLPYYTLSPTYSICNDHGYIVGEHEECPTCGKKTEVYSRITGYYRTVQNWNNGKTQEFNDRKEYVIEEEETEPTVFETVVANAVASIADKASEILKPIREPFEHFSKALENIPDDKIMKFMEENPPRLILSNWYLVTNDHCPNCKITKKLLDTKGVKYEEVHPDDTVDERIDMDRIMTAPTLVIINEGEEAVYHYGAQDISKFLKDIIV